MKNKKHKIVFCHGFPFKSEFFNYLAKAFAEDFEIYFQNLGYYGKKNLLVNENLDGALAIGHGLGFLKLMNSSINFAGYVGISTLLNPNKSTTFKRQLENFIYSYDVNKEVTLSGHVFRCGLATAFDPNGINFNEIEASIKEMQIINVEELCQHKKNNLLFLHGSNDVVFNALDAKEQMGAYEFIVNSKEGHGLGYFSENWCAEQILTFMKKIKFVD